MLRNKIQYRISGILRRLQETHFHIPAKKNLRAPLRILRVLYYSLRSCVATSFHAPLRSGGKKLTLAAFVIFLFLINLTHAQIPTHFQPGTPIPLGHSHNDYLQKRPLWEALENGFTSLEIDIYTAPDSSLRVSHLPFGLRSKPTLDELYLKPLKAWIDQNNGHVYKDTDMVLTLMIDLKGNGAVTYPLLKKALLPYRNYITRYQQRAIYPGPLRILLSGNRPVDLLGAETEQWFSMDGSLGTDYTGKNVRIDRESAPYAAHFKKTGNGTLTAAEREKLQKFVQRTTEQGRELRFWAAGNNPKRWQTLADAGVTVLNADKLKLFRQWVLEYTKNKK